MCIDCSKSFKKGRPRLSGAGLVVVIVKSGWGGGLVTNADVCKMLNFIKMYFLISLHCFLKSLSLKNLDFNYILIRGHP